MPRPQKLFTAFHFLRGKVIHRWLRRAVLGPPRHRMINFGNRIRNSQQCGYTWENTQAPTPSYTPADCRRRAEAALWRAAKAESPRSFGNYESVLGLVARVRRSTARACPEHS